MSARRATPGPAGTQRGAVRAAAAAGGAVQRQVPSQQQQKQQLQNEQHHQQQHHHLAGRRGALLGALASLALPAVVAPRPAAAAAAEASKQSAALEDYMQLETKGKLKDRRALDDFRTKYGMRRLVDGRVQLRSRSGEWFTVRLDMEVPGALLLRGPDGKVYAIETEGLPQVDLSDDYVLLMLFTDGSWQDQMQAIEYEDAENPGKVVPLTMTEKEFREFVGILKGLDEDETSSKKDDKKKKR